MLAAAKAIAMVARLDDWIGRKEGPLDRVAEGLLRRMRFDRRDPVRKWLREIGRDQGAALQLSPEGIDLLDASVADCEGVDYGCVVARVPKPRIEFKADTLLDPEYLALRSLFRLLHGPAAHPHRNYPYPKPDAATQRLLDRALGFAATPAVNDGVVPTLSQLHGRVLHVARADHLDVVGHYTLAGDRTADWLPSGARFPRRPSKRPGMRWLRPSLAIPPEREVRTCTSHPISRSPRSTVHPASRQRKLGGSRCRLPAAKDLVEIHPPLRKAVAATGQI